MHGKSIMPILFPAILVVAGIVYYAFDPTTPVNWFPKCPFHLLTGYQCPACGIQRAMHCLIHGDIISALHYNYFLVISLPLLTLAILAEWYNYHHVFDWANRLIYNRYTLSSYIILFFIWWILRNILGI